eukprot:1182297-Pleurochrysis_carterae.AAC.1
MEQITRKAPPAKISLGCAQGTVRPILYVAESQEARRCSQVASGVEPSKKARSRVLREETGA